MKDGLTRKAIIQNQRRNKELRRQEKAKGVFNTKLVVQQMLKEFSLRKKRETSKQTKTEENNLIIKWNYIHIYQ